MIEPKPFVKWAGGKKQILPYLLHFSPPKFENYFEPFLGGGAFFYRLFFQNKIKKAYLNDINSDLINIYRVIKENPNQLIRELGSSDYNNTKERYYEIRAEEPDDSIKTAARFLYLNKTGFNGLYRVNSRGKFNVPFGKYKNPRILDVQNILAVSLALQKDELTSLDFERAVKKAKRHDFIYFDPPYQPLSKTSNFTSYTLDKFSEIDQERLFKCYRRLDKRGCFVMLSNSYSDLVHDLYSEYILHEVLASRAINCKGDRRGKIKELIVTNYRTMTLEKLLFEQ